MPVEQLTRTMIVDTEPFVIADGLRKRVTRATAFVAVFEVRRTVSTPLAYIPRAGESDHRIEHTEGGHLIPLTLCGADHSANLVPMFGAVNRGTYRAVEREIAAMLPALGSPAMSVAVVYPDVGVAPVDPRLPCGFVISLYQNVARLDPLRPDGLLRMWLVSNKRAQPMRLAITDEDIELRRQLMDVKANHNPDRWRLEMLPDFRDYHDRGYIPAPDRRPNAWVDELIYTNAYRQTAQRLLSKITPGEFTVGSRWGFALQQRQFLQLANRMTQPGDRIGELWSDLADDPVQTALTELGTADGVHIDHIVPEASGGANVYSNAAVTSALYNERKGRHG